VSFEQLGVPVELVKVLADAGITTPFPIQAATIAGALAGRDVCGRAPTGSGKTLAFGVPVAAGAERAQPRHPSALILVPTRELADQVADELRPLAKALRRSVHAFYGGVSFAPQLRALQRGVDIAVACPGRLSDLVNQGEVHLDKVRLVVVDEADRMADMGFLPEVRRLLDRTRPDRQTLLFSATLDGDVDVLIKRYQNDPQRHEVHDPDEGKVRGTHHLWSVSRDERVDTCADIVAAAGSTVVFVRTRHGADRLTRQLGKAGIRAVAIHGDRSQAQRTRALDAFSSGRAEALVATDVAARGIHVDDVACVIHFDLPPDHKDYVHRSGRTARAGAEGVVVALVLPEQRKDAATLARKVALDVELGEVDILDAFGRTGQRHPRPARDAAESRPASDGGPVGDGDRASAPSGPTAKASRSSARPSRRERARLREAGEPPREGEELRAPRRDDSSPRPRRPNSAAQRSGGTGRRARPGRNATAAGRGSAASDGGGRPKRGSGRPGPKPAPGRGSAPAHRSNRESRTARGPRAGSNRRRAR
jgi:superfamily II DNA/RNA helicase